MSAETDQVQWSTKCRRWGKGPGFLSPELGCKSRGKRWSAYTMRIERWQRFSPSTSRILDSRITSQSAFWRKCGSTSRSERQVVEMKQVLKSRETDASARRKAA